MLSVISKKVKKKVLKRQNAISLDKNVEDEKWEDSSNGGDSEKDRQMIL